MAGNHSHGPYDRGEVIARGMDRAEIVALLGAYDLLDDAALALVHAEMPAGEYVLSAVPAGNTSTARGGHYHPNTAAGYAAGYHCTTSTGRGGYYYWAAHGTLQFDPSSGGDGQPYRLAVRVPDGTTIDPAVRARAPDGTVLRAGD